MNEPFDSPSAGRPASPALSRPLDPVLGGLMEQCREWYGDAAVAADGDDGDPEMEWLMVVGPAGRRVAIGTLEEWVTLDSWPEGTELGDDSERPRIELAHPDCLSRLEEAIALIFSGG